MTLQLRINDIYSRPNNCDSAIRLTYYVVANSRSIIIIWIFFSNRNRNLKISKALLKSLAHQNTSLFPSAATNQRGLSKGGAREAQVRFPEYQEGTE